MPLFVMYMCIYGEASVKPCQIFIRFLKFSCLVWRVLYILWVIYQKYALQIFSPSLWLVFLLFFHSLNSVFWRAEVFNFTRVQFINLFYYRLCVSYCIQELFTQPKVTKIFFYVLFWKFYIPRFYISVCILS